MFRYLIALSTKKVKKGHNKAFEKNFLIVNQGYEKHAEEMGAITKKSALTRLSEIRRDNRTGRLDVALSGISNRLFCNHAQPSLASLNEGIFVFRGLALFLIHVVKAGVSGTCW